MKNIKKIFQNTVSAIITFCSAVFTWKNIRPIFPVLALFLGLSVYFTDIKLPSSLASYLSLALLASLDTILGGIKARLEGRFNDDIFITGFIFNTLLAAFLAFLGDQLRIDLFLVTLIVLGWRIFLNLSIIRIIIVNNIRDRKMTKYEALTEENTLPNP